MKQHLGQLIGKRIASEDQPIVGWRSWRLTEQSQTRGPWWNGAIGERLECAQRVGLIPSFLTRISLVLGSGISVPCMIAGLARDTE